MKARLLFLSLALLIILGGSARAAELLPVERLEPLPLTLWVTLPPGSAGDDAVRSAYLRGFFEATHVWAAAKKDDANAAAKYLRLIQGVNLAQVSNLLRRVYDEYPQYRERLTLSQALTICVARARTGLPPLDEDLAQKWNLKPVKKTSP
jgi:hypothetical protein